MFSLDYATDTGKADNATNAALFVAALYDNFPHLIDPGSLRNSKCGDRVWLVGGPLLFQLSGGKYEARLRPALCCAEICLVQFHFFVSHKLANGRVSRDVIHCAPLSGVIR